MYKYVEDKQFLSRMRSLCGEIMQDLCHTLKEEYDIGASFYLVGSGARNLILQNANQPIDLDYNLEITRTDDWEDCKEIKECVRKAFNIVLREYGWSDCQDSTSSLTTEKRHFNQGNSTEFSMDICIVCEDTDGNYHRLIHDKRCFPNGYFWNQAPNSRNIREKAKYIKEKGKWTLVREQYLRIKNQYLTSNDYNHASFINDAINAGKQISFQYYDYTGLKKKVLKNKGEVYKFSPYKLLWCGDYYYVLGYSEKKSKVINFRVDRIASKPEILDKDIIPMPDDFDIENYTKEVFFMFSGEKVLVDLRCDNSLMKTMVDRFGEDVTTLAYDMTSFRVQTEVSASPTFFGWVFGFNGKVQILAPESVKEQYRQMIAKADEDMQENE